MHAYIQQRMWVIVVSSSLLVTSVCVTTQPSDIPTVPALKKSFAQKKAWGLHVLITIKGCDPELIRSSVAIEQYVTKLCARLGVQRHGEPHITHAGATGRDEGFSLTQLIENSWIMGRFLNQTNEAFIDILSSHVYDPEIAATFTQRYFKGRLVSVDTFVR